MEKLTLQRMRKGMSFEECLVAIAEGNIGLIVILPEVCKTAMAILNNGKAGSYGVLSLFDAMEIYGDDLAYLFSCLCKDDGIKLLTVIWAFEVGVMQNQLEKNVPSFAKLETIKKNIANFRSGEKETLFPFDEAKQFIKRNSSIRFPEQEKKQKKKTLLRRIFDKK